MLTRINRKNRITLSQRLLDALGVEAGDLLEVSELNGTLLMMPVRVLPREAALELRAEAARVRRALENGETPDFDPLYTLIDLLADAEERPALPADDVPRVCRNDCEGKHTD